MLQNSWFGSIVAWIYGAWISMKVVKGLRKLLHPPELTVWINCGLDKYESRRGFDEIIASSRIHGLDQLWFG